MDNFDKELLIADKLNSFVLAKEDLVEEYLFFYKNYTKRNADSYDKVNELLQQPQFLNASARCVYESIVSATNSLILNNTFDFEKILYEFLFHKEQLTLGISPELVDFSSQIMNDLRLEIYSKVISQNKDYKISTIFEPTLIDHRKSLFYKVIDEIHK